MKRESRRRVSISSKFLFSYFATTSVLVLITIGIFTIPFVASKQPPKEREEPLQKDPEGNLWEIELKDAEKNFDEFYLLSDLDTLETALRVDINFTKEQKVAFEWSNSSIVHVLSALGQVSFFIDIMSHFSHSTFPPFPD